MADARPPHRVVAFLLKKKALDGQVDSKPTLDEQEHGRAELLALPRCPLLAASVNSPLDLHVRRTSDHVIVDEVPDDPSAMCRAVEDGVAEVLRIPAITDTRSG